MKFAFHLALRNLLRNPGRNLLYILGVSITAALLLDMILLSSGLKVSLLRVLNEMGWELRISPRGTVPFETEAQIRDFGEIKKRMNSMFEAEAIDGMLGATLNVRISDKTFSSFAAGIQSSTNSLYILRNGKEPSENEVLVNRYLARDHNLSPGQTIQIWAGSQEQSIGSFEATNATVSGIVDFQLDAEGQYTIACSLPFLQKLINERSNDPVSIMMIRLKNGSEAEGVAAKINREFPQVSAYTISGVVEAVDTQLSYFRQFSYILGGISLIVTFVLVFIITTISFHDRVGEIALLRAIGIGNKTIFLAVLFEGVLTSLAAAILGFGLGKIVALYLDKVLMSAPGLPAEFSFFVFEQTAVLRALVTLLLTGFFAGLYPASAAVRLPVAATLREEIL